MKRIGLYVLLLAVGLCSCTRRSEYTSPDGHITMNVNTTNGVEWRVAYDGEVVLDWSPIAMTLLDEQFSVFHLGDSSLSVSFETEKVDLQRRQPTYVKRASIRDQYNKVLCHATYADGRSFDIEWRLYNDGAAYRVVLPEACRIVDETAEWHFTGDYEAIIPYEDDLRAGETMCYAFESYYDHQLLSRMYDSIAITPLCVTLPSGVRTIVAETNIQNYPGMFVRKGEGNSLQAVFPRVPTDYLIGGFTDLNLVPTHRADYIADGAQQTPWRVVGVFRNDADILNSDMMQCLAQADMAGASEAERGVYCGQTTWDWWNDWGLEGVDFQPGINNRTYHYYARFAAENGIRYMIVDDGWSDHGDLRLTKGEIDIPALVADAAKQGVGVILWSSYRALRDNTDETMAYFAEMGVKGFKVDFFDRNDQVITCDVWRLADVAKKYDLLLDLHGYMPIGIQAVYPNVMSFEGVKGLENFKWEQMQGERTQHDHPRNVVEVPFLRGFVGPYDYTPGSMRNATYDEFAAGGLHTIGTRCNQLAMYVVQEAPLQMLADSPTEYEKNATSLDMITAIPTIFDDTKVIDARLGEYVVIARRSGTTWYVAAITDQPRTIELPLSFLSRGNHTARLAEDGPEADKRATDVRFSEKTVQAKDVLPIRMAYAGGWLAIIE